MLENMNYFTVHLFVGMGSAEIALNFHFSMMPVVVNVHRMVNQSSGMVLDYSFVTIEFK
jgi:hypothetical protein